MERLLSILSKIENILGDILIEGITEPLVDALRKQINKGRRWLIKELREMIGPLNNDTKKWIAVALTIISTVKAILLVSQNR